MNIVRDSKLMRRAGVLAPMAALAVLLAACGSSSNSSSTTTTGSATTAAKSSYTIAYVPGATGVAFYTSLSNGMKAEAQALGMKYEYQGAAQFSPSAQTPVVEGVCTQHPSVLVVSPTDPVALAPAINTCLNEGVPVITTDTTLKDASKITSQITTNNLQGGQLAADFIGKQIGGSGEVAVLSLSATASTQVQRVQGFQNELKAKFPNIKLVTVQYVGQAISDSTTATNAIMLAHPNLKAIFSVAETGAEGAEVALQTTAAGRKVINVAFDASPSEVKLLQAGKLSATIAQDPALEGKLAAQYAFDKLTGKTSSIKAQVQLNDVLITSADSNQASFSKYFYKL